tara:strand:+ start:124 stop:519 length:396 start_codon:yes stop_codon:yes gene_type:complete
MTIRNKRNTFASILSLNAAAFCLATSSFACNYTEMFADEHKISTIDAALVLGKGEENITKSLRIIKDSEAKKSSFVKSEDKSSSDEDTSDTTPVITTPVITTPVVTTATPNQAGNVFYRSFMYVRSYFVAE